MPEITEVQQLIPDGDVTTTWDQTFGTGGPSHFSFVNDNVDSPDNNSGVGTRQNLRNERHAIPDPVTPTANPRAFNHRVTAAHWRGIFQADFQGATDITITISWFIDGTQQPVNTFIMTFPTNQRIEQNYTLDIPLEDFFNINMRTRNSFGFGFTATTLIQLTEWQMDVTITSDVPSRVLFLDAPVPHPRELYAGFLVKKYLSLFEAELHEVDP